MKQKKNKQKTNERRALRTVPSNELTNITGGPGFAFPCDGPGRGGTCQVS